MVVGQLRAGLGEFAAHAQALEEVDRFGERDAGGGEIAAQGVEAGVEALNFSNISTVLVFICFETNF